MPLVSYPDSDAETSSDPAQDGDSTETPALPSVSRSIKRRRLSRTTSSLPPLPTSFHDSYATNVRTAAGDDPDLHEGRKRQIPHVVGNWPTHVYLEWHPSAGESQRLEDLITRIAQGSSHVHSLLQSDLGAPLPLHISLSRSLSLHTEEREAFLLELRSRFKDAAVASFNLEFDRVAWYPNYEGNRWFLSLGAAKPPANELNRLLKASNDACYATKQPELYVPQRQTTNTLADRKASGGASALSSPHASPADCSEAFHVSLAWSLKQQNISDRDPCIKVEELHDLRVSFDCVKVKIGNIVTSLPLKPKVRRGS